MVKAAIREGLLAVVRAAIRDGLVIGAMNRTGTRKPRWLRAKNLSGLTHIHIPDRRIDPAH